MDLERMQRRPHVLAEGGIDHLVLLDARLATELGRSDGRGPVIVVAGEVAQLDHGVGQRRLDPPFDLVRAHGHGGSPAGDMAPAEAGFNCRSAPALSRQGRHPAFTMRNPSTSLTTGKPVQRSVSWMMTSRSRLWPSSPFNRSSVLSWSQTLPKA